MLLLLTLACSVEAPALPDSPAVADTPVAVPTPPAPAWPASPLANLATHPVKGTLLLDAGHGASGNTGNSNWRCEAEADVMKRVADGVAEALAPVVTVERTRPDAALVAYPDRLKAANRADWLVSLHSDTRAGVDLHADPTTGCYANSQATGFSVLWSDEGDPDLVIARHALARAIARRLVEAGFPAYAGPDYGGLYDPDDVPGVFVDRHAPEKRIMLLRRPTVPSVIVETHEAWDVAEAKRWEETATWTAFAAALGVALGDVDAPLPVAPDP